METPDITPQEYVDSMSIMGQVTSKMISDLLLGRGEHGFVYETRIGPEDCSYWVVWQAADGDWRERMWGDDVELACAPSLRELSAAILEARDDDG